MRPLRNPVIQSALAWCLARWMRFCYATIRWEHRNQELPAVRGSSSNKDKADRDKGGTQALRDGLRQLKVGGLAITPDGPRGPVRSMAEGLPLMAKLSKAPVLFIGLSCNPAIRLNSWDRSLLPLPFGKGAVIWDRADFPEGGDLAEVAAEWRERTTALEAEADALTGLERV